MFVLIPFKSRGPKSRLSSLISEAQRRTLAELLLEDVLGVVSRAGAGLRPVVVTSDEDAAQIARRMRAGVVREESDRGVNLAVEAGIEAMGPDAEYLILPSDLPLVKVSDLDRIRRMKSSGVDVVIAPSRKFDGTNAFLFHGSRPPPLSYDSNSFWRHIDGVGKEGKKLGVYTGAGVLFDVDSVEELKELAGTTSRSKAAIFARGLVR